MSATIKQLKKVLSLPSTFGYGLMSFTWRAPPIPINQAVDTMKCVLKTIPKDSKVMFNVGEFYGQPLLNLQYLQKFLSTLSKDERSQIVVSCKGGVDLKTFAPKGKKEDVRRSIENCLSVTPYIDIFEVARMDEANWEESFDTIVNEYIKKGKIGACSLSEVTKKQIEKVYKKYGDYIVCAELEFSLFSRDILSNGTVDYCNSIGLPIVCYSPLGRGLLTGKVNSKADLPKGDFRSMLARFGDDAIAHNMQLVEFLKGFVIPGKRTLPQIALGWIHKYSERFPGTNFVPIPSGTSEAKVMENFTRAALTDDEFTKINSFLDSFVTKGNRYEFAKK